MSDELPPHYAESVMIGSLSHDGRDHVSVRLARFPARGEAHVWLHFANRDGAWSVVDESFELVGADATPVDEDSVAFMARRGDEWIQFTSDDRNQRAMQGQLTGSVRVLETRHPGNRPGEIPVSLDLDFVARGSGFRSPTGRRELTGSVRGEVTVDTIPTRIDHDGKWHEQTGPRARFAPAFTYFNVYNERLTLLAIDFETQTRGYAIVDGKRTVIEHFEIDDQGPDERVFQARLGNGRTVEGTARRVQDWSVEIEGKRRPGSSVIVDSNYGSLIGDLNDWNPEVRTE